MKRDTRKRAKGVIFLAVVVLTASVLFRPSRAVGQNLGNNAVYNSSGNCSPNCAASAAFIDASVSQQLNQTDLCATIYNIFKGIKGNPTYPAAGAVIDARGISGSTALTCAAGTTPWNNGATSVSAPSNILLPAGTIVISTGWVLPVNTHLIGQGDNIASGTVIQAASNVGNMISFYSSLQRPPNPPTIPYTGIAVEKLVLDGNGKPVSGIVNNFAGSLSYVDHVSLYRILGTGLAIGGVASGSGPYTNINFNTGGSTATSSTVCAGIAGQSAFTGTAGIRGLTCTSNGTPSAAVLLNASSNSIKDVSIDGFKDGIAVGENAAAQSNVLINVSYPGLVGVTNLIHICGNDSVKFNPCSTYNTVTDLVIIGATTPPFSCPPNQTCIDAAASIKDDVSGTFLSTQSDPDVGMYVLGGPKNGGYSRFTTSANLPTWAVGATAPTGACAQGSLYSCASMSASSCSSHALWGCPISPGSAWEPIK